MGPLALVVAGAALLPAPLLLLFTHRPPPPTVDLAERLLRERIDDAEERARQADAHNEATTRFMARISHELRTPLNAIIGYCELLLEDARGTQAQDLRRIRTSGRHLLGLVDSVLDLSQLEAGDFDVRPGPVLVHELVAQVAEAAGVLAEENRTRLLIDAPESLGTVVLDPRMLRQILFNLVTSACRFTVEGTVRVRAERQLQGLVLTVEDDGIGMTPRQVEQAFTPFAPHTDGQVPAYAGAGVGPAVCKAFSTAMQGSIDIQSAPGEGATVTVRLPLELRLVEAAAHDLDEDPTVFLR